jgi:hypothetical protein
MPCRLLFVITNVAAPLVVFMVIEPKLSVEGATPTPARVEMGERNEPIKTIPTNRHTNRALTI